MADQEETIVLSSGFKVNFTDEFIKQLTQSCLKYNILQPISVHQIMDKHQQTLLYAIASELKLDITAAEMQEITNFLRRELYNKARSYARDGDGLCSAPRWLHDAVWRMRLLPVEHLPAPTEALPCELVSGFALSARAMRALLRRLRQTLTVIHDPVLGVIWEDLRYAALTKLIKLLQAGDLLPDNELLTHFEWRIVDLVLLHNDELPHPIINGLTRPHRWQAQEATTEVALRHRVDERVCRAELARRWGRAHQAYILKGLRGSLVLLQRRWYEMKRRSLRALAKGKPGGAPCALRSRVGRHAAALPPALAWPDLVRTGMVFTEQDVIENELESETPSYPPDVAFVSVRDKSAALDTPNHAVKLEQRCYKKALVVDEKREGAGGESSSQQDCSIKEESDRVVPLFIFESDEDFEPEVIGNQTETKKSSANTDVISKTSSENWVPPKKPKLENCEDSSITTKGPDDSCDPQIDRKLLMDIRVEVERLNIEPYLRGRVPRRESADWSGSDSGSEWAPEGWDGSSDSEAAGGARRVTLRDIDEVRRLTQLKLTAQVAPVASVVETTLKHEDTTQEESESTANNTLAQDNQPPCAFVKVTSYCPFGLKKTRLRYGASQTKREQRRAAMKKLLANKERPAASSRNKIKYKKKRNRNPETDSDTTNPTDDMSEWIRQRNINSLFFGPAPDPMNSSLVDKTPSKVGTSFSPMISTTRSLAPSSPADMDEWRRQRNINSRFFKPGFVSTNPSLGDKATSLTGTNTSLTLNISAANSLATSRPNYTSTPLKNNGFAQYDSYSKIEPATEDPLLLTNGVPKTNATSPIICNVSIPSLVFTSHTSSVPTSQSTTTINSIACQASTSQDKSACSRSLVMKINNRDVTINTRDQESKSSQYPDSIRNESRNIASPTTENDQASNSSQLPTSSGSSVKECVGTVSASTTAGQASNSAQLTASSVLFIKDSQSIVSATAAGERFPSQHSQKSVSSLMLNRKDITVNTSMTDQAPPSLYSPASDPSLLNEPSTVTNSAGGKFSTSSQLRSTVPSLYSRDMIMTTTTETTPIPRESTVSVPMIILTPNEEFQIRTTVKTPTYLSNQKFLVSSQSLLASSDISSKFNGDLTSGTPMDTKVQQLIKQENTNIVTYDLTVETNEEVDKSGSQLKANENEEDGVSSEQKKLLEDPKNEDSDSPAITVAIAQWPRLKPITTIPKLLVYGNDIKVSAIDFIYRFGNNYKGFKVICKDISRPFWIVSDQYLVLSDDSNFIAKKKRAYYTLAPPKEIEQVILDVEEDTNGEADDGENSLGHAGGDAGGMGGKAVMAPNRLQVEGKTYQKLCRSPLRYAQVLGGVGGVEQCRRLQARDVPLHLYCARRRRLEPLRSMRQLLRLLHKADVADENVTKEIEAEDNAVDKSKPE